VGRDEPKESRRGDRVIGALLAVAATAFALVAAVPYAGSPNDGSRLATVEALVDYHTLAIDDSIYVKPPPKTSPREKLPYPAHWAILPDTGTVDKLRVNGHFYSDKPPTPALFLAGVYQLLQWTTGLKATERADLFCWAMTVASSGLAYVLAVWGTFQLGRALRLGRGSALLLALSLGASTVAAIYVCQVNNHILQLGVAVLLLWQAIRLAEGPAAAAGAWRLALIGTLAGLGYAIEQASGALLLAGTVLVVGWYCRGWRGAALAAGAALPWVVLHHAVTYSFAHTLRPIGAVPEYFDYPGSEFHAGNLTGLWNHPSLADFADYSWRLLFGGRGFIQSNVPLFLALAAGALLLWRRRPERPLLWLAALWAAGTWLVYAALSRNYAGVCCSIRWFVPLLAPAYLVLAVLLRDHPAYRLDLLLLSGWGARLAFLMWDDGPWGYSAWLDGDVFWDLQTWALATWAGCRAACWAWGWYRLRRPALARA
jgi:hypothetical protein